MPISLPDDMITPKAASAVLGVHVGTIYRLVRRGELRAWRRIGGRLMASRKDVQELLAPVLVAATEGRERGVTHEEVAAGEARARLEASWKAG